MKYITALLFAFLGTNSHANANDTFLVECEPADGGPRITLTQPEEQNNNGMMEIKIEVQEPDSAPITYYSTLYDDGKAIQKNLSNSAPIDWKMDPIVALTELDDNSFVVIPIWLRGQKLGGVMGGRTEVFAKYIIGNTMYKNVPCFR